MPKDKSLLNSISSGPKLRKKRIAMIPVRQSSTTKKSRRREAGLIAGDGLGGIIRLESSAVVNVWFEDISIIREANFKVGSDGVLGGGDNLPRKVCKIDATC